MFLPYNNFSIFSAYPSRDIDRRFCMEKQLSLAAKLLLIGAGGLAFVAGPILWLFSTQTTEYFAWTIKHQLTPLFIGANYLGGLGALWAHRMSCWSVFR